MGVRLERGFTLIELLVVIAIIGMLSSVVLASLNSARQKGNDTAVRADLSTVATQAALFLSLSTDNSYGAFNNGTGGSPAACPAAGASGTTVFHNTTVGRALAAALVNSGGGAAFCVSTDTAFAAAVSRPDTTNSAYWCVDSVGSHCGVNTLNSTTCSCVTSE